jgi:hypothetical protein
LHPGTTDAGAYPGTADAVAYAGADASSDRLR